MAKTRYETIEEKQLLQARALLLKPNLPGVVATDRGWAIPTSRGPLELLVSFGGLDQLLGDEISENEVSDEPALTITTELTEEPKAEVITAEIKEEVKVEAPVVKAKPGPKKKVAAE